MNRPTRTARQLSRRSIAPLIACLTAWPTLSAARPFELQCPSEGCLHIIADAQLQDEAEALADALERRLCSKHIAVYLTQQTSGTREGGAPRPATRLVNPSCLEATGDNAAPLTWNAHIKHIDNENILVAVDFTASGATVDLVRELPHGPDPVATAWTVALMIEEALRPYLSNSQEPLAVGLALIEPPEVAGSAKKATPALEPYPLLRYVGLGVFFVYLGATESAASAFLAGPNIQLRGLLARKLVASIAAGWSGTADVDHPAQDLGIRVSAIPFDIYFGYLLLDHRTFILSLDLGLSAGFTIFEAKFDGQTRDRTDIYFDPMIQSRMTFGVRIFGPLGLYLQGGIALPIRRDILRYDRVDVYRQDWLIPQFGGGLSLWL